jgi:hypothetical protein
VRDLIDMEDPRNGYRGYHTSAKETTRGLLYVSHVSILTLEEAVGR